MLTSFSSTVCLSPSLFSFTMADVDMEDAFSSSSSSSSPTMAERMAPLGLTSDEFTKLESIVTEYHNHTMDPGKCSSLLSQRVEAPLDIVWSIVRRFDKPQTYKHFIKSCSLKEGSQSFTTVGCLRDVNVISGLPATSSTDRLDILDDDRHVTGFSIIGGDHRLKNYRSVTTVNQFSKDDGRIWTVVLESYVVDVPEGNTIEETRTFADTFVSLNLQKLATITESMARGEEQPS